MPLRGQAQGICCLPVHHSGGPWKERDFNQQPPPCLAASRRMRDPGESVIPQARLRFPGGWARPQRKLHQQGPTVGELFHKQLYTVLQSTLSALHFLLRISWAVRVLIICFVRIQRTVCFCLGLRAGQDDRLESSGHAALGYVCWVCMCVCARAHARVCWKHT